MKKRILSIVLSIVMLVGLLPTTALAIPAPAHTAHYSCGVANCDADHNGDADGFGHSEVASWTALSTKLTYDSDTQTYKGTLDGGNYYLDDNINLGTTYIAIYNTVNLCLNGKTITGTSTTVIQVQVNATLNLCDCTTGGTAGKIENTNNSTGSGTTTYGIYNSGTINVYGGTISATTAATTPTSGSGSGIYNYGGEVTVVGTGAVVSGTYYGIYNYNSNSTVTVSGGTVSGKYGIYNKGSVTVSGGEIKTTDSDYGIENSGTVTVSGGTVTGYTGINNSGTVNVSSVGIVQTTSSGRYGINNSGGTVTVSGGTVQATANNGQGIYNKSGGNTTISGGTVQATGTNGQGICNYSGTLNLSGEPTITGTTADVYLNNAIITISGALTYTDEAISVKMENPGTFTSGWTEKMSDAAENYGSYFTSKNEGYTVQPDGDELKLAEPPAVETHKHPICGETCTHNGSHSTMDNWTEWTSTTSLPTSSGNYYLSGDVTISSTWSPQNNTVLCLNGKTITMSNSGASDIQDVITIGDGVTFTLTDCQSTVGKITHTDVGYGRGVNVAAGTFNMYGGSITGNTNSLSWEVEGGGVYVRASGIFNLYGGSITGNEVKLSQSHQNLDQSYGGGIYIDGIFNMNGGSIANNKTTNSGGGVCVDGGTFDMDGGSISGNQAGSHGGGVYFRSGGGTFNMNGGSISENQAGSHGGGVYTYYGCTFNMVGGSISDNNATHDGGGVYVYGTFNLRGTPTISENTANGSGNNVSVSANRNINVVGALTNTTPIGVTNRDSGTGRFAVPSGDVTTLAEGYADKFTSDNQTYDVLVDDVNLKLAQMVTVSFNANGGSGTMTSVEAEKGEAYTLPTCTFTAPTDKQFKGWATSAAGEVISTNEITIEGATPLYAIWEDIPTTCTVSFNMNGHGEEIAAATVSRGEKVTKPADPTATGYTFGGWYKEQACMTAWDFAADTVSTNTTLYAKWTANTYQVTFNSNGGSQIEPSTVSHGSKISSPGTPTKTGEGVTYRFDGWYKNSSCTVAWDFDNDTITATTTLYAKWTEMHTASGTITGFENTTYTGIPTAQLVALGGSTTDATVQAKENGNETSGPWTYSATVPAGQYNLVVTATESEEGEKTVTVTALVDLTHDSNRDLALPTSTKSSTVKASDDSTPKVIAGGVDEIAKNTDIPDGASTITIKLTVDEETEDAVSSDAEKIESVAGGQTIDLYLDIQLTLYEDDSINGTDLGSTNTQILELLVPANTNKAGLTVYRVHNGVPEAMKNGSPDANGEYFKIGDGFITIYAKKFSVYAIGYTPENTYTITLNANGGTVNGSSTATLITGTDKKLPSLPTPTRSGSYTFDGWYNGATKVDENTIYTQNTTLTAKWTYTGSTGGGDYTPTYAIIVEDAENGEIKANRSYASSDSTVTITVDPEAGYVLNKLTVKDDQGNKIEVIDKGDGTFTFKMPSRKVSVEASFVDDGSFSTCPGDHTCPIWPYTDAETTAWYHDGVHYIIEKGLMTGYGNGIFKPNTDTSRAMIAVMLWRLEGSPVVNYLLDFEDVKADAWYTEAIRWAKSEGIIGGYGNGCWGPDDAITREQMVTILWRYAQYKGYDVSVGENTNILSYNDAFDVAEYAIPAMQWACGSGMVQGMNDPDGEGMILAPESKGTRAQIATMIMRFCTEIVQK